MREQSALFLACVAVAITRIAALSRSMCDWDEALFCLGVRDYDVPAYRPHPPGFPLFVGAAKLLRPIAASFRRSKDASGTTSDVYAVDLTTGARRFVQTVRPPDAAGVEGVFPILYANESDSFVFGYKLLLTSVYMVDGLR